jgi:hypothetical protein
MRPVNTHRERQNDFRLTRSSSESGTVCLITYRTVYLVISYVCNIYKIIPPSWIWTSYFSLPICNSLDKCNRVMNIHIYVCMAKDVVTHMQKKKTKDISSCELSIEIEQHSSSAYLWSVYLLFDLIFQSLCFLSWIVLRRVAAINEVAESRVSVG